MRWYINDASLQGQYPDVATFLALLGTLISARSQCAALKTSLYITRSFVNREVCAGRTLQAALSQAPCTDLRKVMLSWLDKTGPFVDDDRLYEPDDYFECMNIDITDTGLGEAARRVKAYKDASALSFPGGLPNFGTSLLLVRHGLSGDRLGTYEVKNIWSLDGLFAAACATPPEPTNWQQLVVSARAHFPRLQIPDSVYTNDTLAREPFDAVIRDRAWALFKHLDDYMKGRIDNRSDGPKARAVIKEFFRGDQALFSGESKTNKRDFKKELTFKDPGDPSRLIFAHWHGKIMHRHFRLHFEWPVPTGATQLMILYLGPKITKN